MRSRVIVALIGIPLVYLATWLQWKQALVFALLVAAATVVAGSELYRMTREWRPYVPAGLVAIGATPLLAWRALEPGVFAGLLLVIPLTMIFASLSVEREQPFSAIATTFFGSAYIGIA